MLNPSTGPKIRRVLIDTGRLPADVEWMEVPAVATLSEILRVAGVRAGRVEFIKGTCSYRPNLFQRLHEWDGDAAAIELVDSGRPIGLVALGREMADKLAVEREKKIVNEMDLHHWIAEHAEIAAPGSDPYIEVDEESWQAITQPEDLQAAECKLGSMAREADRRDIRPDESPCVDPDQQATDQVPNHSEHGELIHTCAEHWSRRVLRRWEVIGTALPVRCWECGGAFWTGAMERLPG